MSNFRSTILAYDLFLEDGLFKNLVVPDGIDKQTLIDTILLECGEMTPVWTDPFFMQNMIGTWSQKWQHTFERWIKALETDYEPLNNYDRTEEWTTDTKSNVNSNTTAETDKSAYDSASFTPYDKATGKSTDDATGNEVRKGRAYGNIGVTTSQQMLQAEYDVARWNIYEHIKDLFMQDFCIMIY